MNVTSILTTVVAAVLCIAAVLSVEGDLATIDKGAADGLRPGDSGRAFYILRVGAERREKRIDVGRFEVVAVDESAATLRGAAGVVLRAGYSAEIEVSDARLPRTAPAEVKPMVHIPGGVYTVGVDLAEARFYNQHPRFRVKLRSFLIDPSPVTQAELRSEPPETGSFSTPATLVTYDEALQHCRRLGKRLPSELEWEIAVQAPGVEVEIAISEWTSSWYQPYPGNLFPEKEYGELYRVLRGAAGSDEVDPRSRRFMAPSLKRSDVGFRCARSGSDSDDPGGDG